MSVAGPSAAEHQDQPPEQLIVAAIVSQIEGRASVPKPGWVTLAGQGCGDEVLPFVADKLATHEKVDVLVLSHNPITDAGAAVLAAALATSSTVSILDVCHTNIGPSGIEVILGAMRASPVSRVLLYTVPNPDVEGTCTMVARPSHGTDQVSRVIRASDAQ